MTQNNYLNEEESRLIDTINRMSSQIYVSARQTSTSEHAEFLAEVIEHLREELESLRKGRMLSSTS